MEYLYTFCTVGFMILIILRIIFVNSIVDKWNKNLYNYIRTNENRKDFSKEYFNRCYINHMKYYVRLDIWTIKQIINDPLLLTDIDRDKFRQMIKDK